MIRNQSSISQCICSRAHFSLLRRLIHDTNGLGYVTYRRKPTFLSAIRMVSALASISRSFANCTYVACLPSEELVIARVRRRTSLGLSLGGLPVWDLEVVRGSPDLITRRTVGVGISVASLI